MNYDEYGRAICNDQDIVTELYRNPDLDLENIVVDQRTNELYASAVKKFFLDWKSPMPDTDRELTVEEFDRRCRENWYMPTEYKELDIAKWLLDQCDTQEKLQRVGQELLLYSERDLMDLLRFLKFMVDTMRSNNIVWGLGRGSSVASYVLYLIGVHKIDSMYYDLNVEEFLR